MFCAGHKCRQVLLETGHVSGGRPSGFPKRLAEAICFGVRDIFYEGRVLTPMRLQTISSVPFGLEIDALNTQDHSLPPFSPTANYCTQFGSAYVGDSRDLLESLPDESVNLVITSPPFALLRKKTYGNKDQSEYVDWFLKVG